MGSEDNGQEHCRIIDPTASMVIDSRPMPRREKQLAVPIVTQIPTGGFRTFGGMTKLETVAMHVAGGLASYAELNFVDVAPTAVKIAEQVIQLCEKREDEARITPITEPTDAHSRP